MDWKRLIVIIVVLVIYLCVGSVIFNALEADSEKKRASDLKEQYATFLANNTCVNQAELLNLVQRIIVDSGLALHVAYNLTDDLDRWDFSGSFGFAVSVVTTIGYGNMAPHTLIGKAVCVAYALLGIPLTLIMLNAMGARLALVLARINKLQLCSHKPLINKVVNMLIILTLGCLIMFVAPAFMFNRVEGWNFVESLYFCFITLSTIGFGDYIIGVHQPKTGISQVQHDIYQVAAYVWILFGLAYLSLMVKYITDVLVKNAGKVEKKTMRILETRRRPASPDGTPSRDGTLSRSESLHRSSNPTPNGTLPRTSPRPRNASRSKDETTRHADLSSARSDRNSAEAVVMEDWSAGEGSNIAIANYAYQEWPAASPRSPTVWTTRDDNDIQRTQM